jgi:AAA+ superfamily predicted ATPase
MANPDDLLIEILREPPGAVTYAASSRLSQARAGKHLHETEDVLFDPHGHAMAGKSWMVERAGVHAEYERRWIEPGEPFHTEVRVGWFDVRWQGRAFELMALRISAGYRDATRWYLLADDAASAESYVQEVCKFASEVNGEILVFNGGCWTKSRELAEAIAGISFDDLILAEELRQRVRTDFEDFLGSRAQYQAWGVPWKRGALFVGPPGNGKTMCIKALSRHLGLPVLYVQSFKASYSTEQACVAEVFTRARRVAPCLMVLEDLDALVTPEARSFFLNELDGFAANDGIVTIGSTNHPELLDPAIVDRPSRFDRKYHFELPGAPERRRYLERWNEKLTPELRCSGPDLDAATEATPGFSFAYLKELMAASLMRFASKRGQESFAELLRDEAGVLRRQMQTKNIVPELPAVPAAPAGVDAQRPGTPGA